MLKILRLMIILLAPALLWLGWSISPALISPENMRYLGGIFIAVWGLSFHFLAKSSELSNVTGLSGLEHARLVAKMGQIRSRVWWIGGVLLISSFLLWVIGSMSSLADSPIAPISIGLLVGFGLSYLILIPGWYNELHSFTDTIRLRNENKRRTEVAIKQIEEGKQASQRTPAVNH